MLLANRKSGKLLFSLKPKEKEELIEKKRSLMVRVTVSILVLFRFQTYRFCFHSLVTTIWQAKLQVGDVVKGCITKITYFGIFVEVIERFS